MPRYPSITIQLDSIEGAVFSALAHRMATYDGEIYPLHVGDTWLEPADGCRMQDLTVDEHPGMHRYAPPRGMRDLIDAIAQRAHERTGAPAERSQVLVSAGATGALGAVLGAVVEPGDEVLILAPYWPLITGIVRGCHGVPVAVAFEAVDSAEAAVAQLERFRSPRSVALYLSTPNNPSGRVLPRAWLEAMADWCRRHELWIASDEVYEDYVYSGRHTYCRELAPERTFSTHSFSKAFGMAGNRCGYVVGPEPVVRAACKVSTHTFYSTPTASQLAALRALDGRGDAWVTDVRERYRRSGEDAARRLGVPFPEGGTFLFVDVGAHLDDRGLVGLLEDCADRGLFLAPGPSFGPYDTHVRLCFTSAAPEVVSRGVEILAERLGR